MEERRTPTDKEKEMRRRVRRHRRLHSFSFTACRFSAVIKSAPGEELSSFRARRGTCVAEKKRRAAQNPPSSSLLLSRVASLFPLLDSPDVHCESSLKSALLSILEGASLSEEFLEIIMTVRRLFSCLEILIVMGYM